MMKKLELWLGIKKEKGQYGLPETRFFNIATQTDELRKWIEDNENLKIEYINSNYETIFTEKNLPIEWYIQVQQNWDEIINHLVQNTHLYKMSDFNVAMKNKKPIEIIKLIKRDYHFNVNDEYFRIVNNYFIESIPKHLLMERIKNDIEYAIDSIVKING